MNLKIYEVNFGVQYSRETYGTAVIIADSNQTAESMLKMGRMTQIESHCIGNAADGEIARVVCVRLG